ncbi:MAG: heme exporter protein CcmD [Granulosicoccus sp.]|nr:heme exporter protein CcmD [Granulosicoccus sp.]
MIEFLSMGGYAFYVWSSYAIATLLLGGIVIWSARRYRSVRNDAINRARRYRRKS